MATNFVQPGCTVTVAAPTGGVTSGQGVLIGYLFGVAANTVAQTLAVEITTDGVWDLAKETGQAFATVGDRVYWDATNKWATDASSTGVRIGVVVRAALAGDATVRVRLDGAPS